MSCFLSCNDPDPPHSLRMMHMNSRIFCTSSQSAKAICGTSISISLQRGKM
jgi:hypothetical protein